MTTSQGVGNMLLLVVFIALIYFMMIRPQRKKDKADREMRASLQVGDEVVTIGGIVGKIEKIGDKTVIISTGAGRNKIEFLKTAIGSVSKGDSASSEPRKETKPEPAEEKTPDKEKKVTPKKLTRKGDNGSADADE